MPSTPLPHRCISVKLLLLLPLLIGLAACVPQGPNADRNGQLGAESFRSIQDRTYGVSLVLPSSTRGNLDKPNNCNLAFIPGDKGVSLIFLTDLGGQEPDDYAMTCAGLRPLNMPFPSDKVHQLKTTEKDGIRWLHYKTESEENNQRVITYFDIARKGNVLVNILNVSFLRGLDTDPSWDANNIWWYIHFDDNPRDIPANSLNEKNKRISEIRLNQIAASYAERNRPNDAIPYIQRLRELRPSYLNYAENLADLLIRTKDYETALNKIEILKKIFPFTPGLTWRRALTLGELGRKEEALSEYHKAIVELDDKSLPAINAYLSYLDKIDELGANIDEVEQLVSLSGNPELQYYLAKACVDFGDKDRAKQIIDGIVDKCEAYPQLADPIVSIYLETENYEEALAISRRIIEQNNPTGHYLAAATLMREGRFKEAREEVITCIEKMPANQNAKNLLDSINAQMGKADSSSFSTPIDLVALPDDFESLIPEESEGMEYGFGSHFVYIGKAHYFNVNAKLRTTHYGKYQVSTVEAIRQMNDLRFPFDPLYERVFVNYIRVYGPDGVKIDEGNMTDFYTANDPDEVLMSQKKELHTPIPSLSPGCTVEYAVTYETLGKKEKMPFQTQQLSRDKPVLLSFTCVRGDLDQLMLETANEVKTLPETTTGDDMRFFFVQKPLPLTYAPNTPPALDYIPTVWISAAGNSWADEADEYFKTVTSLDDESPEATAKAKEILGDKFSDEEAVHKLAAFVRDSLTYHGIEFGVRAMIPNTCDDILRNRYGDCKDHSYLLMKMLRASGVDANLALIDSSRNINIKVPDSGQFDHMIVYLPNFHGGHFIDTTDKGCSDAYEPLYLEGCPALILDKANPRIETVRSNPMGANGFNIDRTVKIDASGDAIVTERARFSGLWAGTMRSYLRDKTPVEYAPYLLNSIYVSELDGVKSITARNLDDLDKDVELEYQFRLKNAFTIIDGKLIGSIPITWEGWELSIPNDQPERKLPIWQRNHAVYTSNTTMELPEGYTLKSPADIQLDIKTDYISVNRSSEIDGDSIIIKGDYARPSGMYAANERDARENAYADALKAIRAPIVLVKK